MGARVPRCLVREIGANRRYRCACGQNLGSERRAVRSEGMFISRWLGFVRALIELAELDSSRRGKRGAFCLRRRSYFAMRSLDRLVPIWAKIALICDDDVTNQFLLVSLAHCCSMVEVGSPPVLTCSV